jgi:hypothetical protein
MIATTTIQSGDTAGPAAFGTGDRLAIILHRLNQPADSVSLVDANPRGFHRVPQTLFTAPEQMTGIDWSPNRQWLITSSPTADQWIFIRVIAPTRFSAVGEIADQFRPKGARAPGFPALGGWQP